MASPGISILQILYLFCSFGDFVNNEQYKYNEHKTDDKPTPKQKIDFSIVIPMNYTSYKYYYNADCDAQCYS